MYYKTMIEDEVFTFLNANQHFKDNTRLLYGTQLKIFFEWAISEGYEPSTINGNVVYEYFTNHNYSNSSRCLISTILRSYYRYKYGSEHPISQLKTKRAEVAPQRTLSEKELTKFMACIDTSTVLGIRDLAIITLMADTGLRVSEMTHLEVKHLNLDEMRLNCRVKGGRWTERVFFDYTASCLRAWNHVRERYDTTEIPYVFFSVSRRKSIKPLSRTSVACRFEIYSRRCNIENVTPHSLRRTFATLAIENGAPTRLVQHAGGWNSVEMVERYSRKINATKMRKYSPINNVMGICPDSFEVARLKSGLDFEPEDY